MCGEQGDVETRRQTLQRGEPLQRAGSNFASLKFRVSIGDRTYALKTSPELAPR